MHPNRAKGIKAEREVAALISDHLGITVTRRYNLGTHEDTGDLVMPDTVVQVVNYQDIVRAISEKLPECAEQQRRAKALFGATFVRRRGGEFVVVLSVPQWLTYARASMQ